MAYGINAAGEVAGYSGNSSANSGNGQEVAILYSGSLSGLTTALGLNANYSSIASVINQSGEIAGSYWLNSDPQAATAFIYNGSAVAGSQVTTLTSLGGQATYVYGITAGGEVVGNRTPAAAKQRLFLHCRRIAG